LYCECGAEVIHPPVACGTRRPICNRPCSRQHTCNHEVLHNCHSEQSCPPCSVLTRRWCHGKHELRNAVPCYVKEISCGLACNKPLPCGRHKCIMICHAGPCEKLGQQCIQPCTATRELCGHICAAPCHEGNCPDTLCKEIVKVINRFFINVIILHCYVILKIVTSLVLIKILIISKNSNKLSESNLISYIN